MHIQDTTLKLKMNKVSFLTIFLVTLIIYLLQGGVAEALCIKGSKANLRKGPGKHHKKLWTVFKYMPFKQLKRRGNWLKIQDLERQKFWVHKKLTTKKYMCAVIKNSKTRLREGPGTNFPEVEWSPIDKFYSAKVLKIKNAWVHIEDGDGDRAWVHRPLVWVQ